MKAAFRRDEVCSEEGRFVDWERCWRCIGKDRSRFEKEGEHVEQESMMRYRFGSVWGG